MNVDKVNINDNTKLLANVTTREKLEKRAKASFVSEVLRRLNISFDTLPQNCQELLKEAATYQMSVGIDTLDPVALSLLNSMELSEKLEDEYEILKLEQKNIQLQVKIDRNKKFIEDLKKDLQCSKDSLASKPLNPENIQDHIRQLEQKFTSYEQSCEKAKIKFEKLNVPEELYPKSLESLISTLAALKVEAHTLKERAEEFLLAKEASETIRRLRRQ